MAFFLAQLPNPADIAPWIQVLTAGGFMLLTWYLIVKSIPKMQDRFDTTADSLSKTFSDTMKTQQDTCKEEIKSVCASYERHIDRIIDQATKVKP